MTTSPKSDGGPAVTAGPTKGPVRVVEQSNGDYRIVYNDAGNWFAKVYSDGEGDVAKADANLIAEAFNTFHDTGLTPRQLADDLRAAKSVLAATREHVCRLEVERDEARKQRDELLRACCAILPFIPKSSAAEGGPNARIANVAAADMVRAAIASATPAKGGAK